MDIIVSVCQVLQTGNQQICLISFTLSQKIVLYHQRF